MKLYEHQTQWMPMGTCGVYLKLAFRLLQFILGITIFGIYTADIVAAGQHKASPPPAWLLAATLGGLNTSTAILYILPCLHSYLFFWWDWILVILHAGVVGVFAKAYIANEVHTENPKGFKLVGPDFQRERSAAYIDCVSGSLWLATAMMSTVILLKIRRMRQEEAMA